MNIYLTAAEGLRKFDQDGNLIWEYKRGAPGYSLTGEITCSASLLNGRMYSYTTDCNVFAVSMASGQELWKTRLSDVCGADSGYIMAQDGIVLAASDAVGENFKMRVHGLDAADGHMVWSFRPDGPVWTFMGSFPNDGTFVYQDCEGRVYRQKTATGEVLWKAGGRQGTWTDGQALLGSNGIVYGVTRFANLSELHADISGSVSAYRLSDGAPLWDTEVPQPPDDPPVLGMLPGFTGPSLVQPIGQQVVQGAPTFVYAFDAETGGLQWIFEGPVQQGKLQRGDEEGRLERRLAGVRELTLPHPWSAPTIDGTGTVYIGNEEGYFYGLVDRNLDGFVMGESEVASYDARACFHGDSAPAIAPGMLVMTSTDTLMVFKDT